MAKREKRLKKAIESLQKQIEIHKEKIENEVGRKDTTKDYWREEIGDFEKEMEKKEEMLRKLGK